jgi:DNA-binding winged helix-turn-helix (wHTH) protein
VSPPAPRTRYRFAGFVLSPARRSLRRDGREVPLIPRYLDLLLLLVENRQVALHRHQIFDRVWPDVVVSDGALTQAVRTLRRTLGEGDDGRFIRTVSRHGYQFVCEVTEEEDDGGDGPAATATVAARPPGDDPMKELLARLLDEGSTEEARREAAEELHSLGTATALSRLGRERGHARAWAHLRDSRWEVAGAGEVPLLGPPASLAGWAALAVLRGRRALRLAGARWVWASLGGALAGAAAGLAGAVAMVGLGDADALSVLGPLALVGAVVAGTGAAGVGFGLAAGEALVRSWRTAVLTAAGALGGGLVGAVSQRVVVALLGALSGQAPPAIGGGLEGLCLGGAAGLGFGLATRGVPGLAAPRGRARVLAAAATALACGLAGAVVSARGGRLGAASLDAVVRGFPATRVHLAYLGRPFREKGLGPATSAGLGLAEGLLFGAGLAAGLTRRPRRREAG